MRKSTSGFTIVELLIVVVVIGILAAIVIVAYNGITTQAKNSQTISAANTWIKAMRLYEVENGSLPNVNSCLGSPTTYTGSGQCWDSTYWTVKTSFLNLMQPYISTYPEPDISEIDSTNYPDRRGLLYVLSSGSHYIYIMLTGTSDCPSINSGTFSYKGTYANGVECRYKLD
jgi:prepilin-type N-terminal cleavage/methylation domain-containing protein|tara:strand:+ start:2284 stop:2799 length:516 start_codon:yes stop_codon:yes gene_type:complete